MNANPRHSEPHSPANPCTPRCTGHPDHEAREIDAAAAFAAAWEKAQGAIGQILRAYYYGTRPEYVAAVSAAAYAIAELEALTSPKHEEARP
jgi:hypothetical protein